jgi:sulfur-oxidizing protein SoxX
MGPLASGFLVYPDICIPMELQRSVRTIIFNQKYGTRGSESMKLSRIAIVFCSFAGAVGMLFQPALAQDKKKTAPALVAYDISDGPAVKAINKSLTGKKGDPAKGENLIAARKKGNCFACHEVARLMSKAVGNPKKYSDMGKIAPRLDGVASRYTEGELRMLLVDSKKIFPETIMPAFYRKNGLNRVKGKFKGKPILKAQEVEDILAYVMTLQEPQRHPRVAKGTPATPPAAGKFDIAEGPTIKAINSSLTAGAGDAEKGEDLIAARKKGNCFACHEVGALVHKIATNPKKYSDMGNIAPRLDGVAKRYTKGELRMLIVDAKQVFPETIMPAFLRKKALHRVKKGFKDKTILNPQEVEDILAYLVTLNVEQTADKGGIGAQTKPDTADPALGDN